MITSIHDLNMFLFTVLSLSSMFHFLKAEDAAWTTVLVAKSAWHQRLILLVLGYTIWAISRLH
jgi:hypothetical protein